MYVLLCVGGDDGGVVYVGVIVYVCVVCVDRVAGGCDAAGDDCDVAGGDCVCCRAADRCVGDGVDVECVGCVGVADDVGYVVVDVR